MFGAQGHGNQSTLPNFPAKTPSGPAAVTVRVAVSVPVHAGRLVTVRAGRLVPVRVAVFVGTRC